MQHEMKMQAAYLKEQEVDSVYFGGGTPSLLLEEELQALLETVRTITQIRTGAEITLEANPDDITEEGVRAWQRMGVNRLSIGIQSFREEDLRWMNRAHSVSDARACVELAKKAGINDLTVDLMYGLPGLSEQEWEAHIRQVIEMGVNHVSAYCLTVEERTVLNNWVQRGTIQPASEQQQAEQFIILTDTLTNHGFEHYEISNFAKPGYRAKHNSAYWKGKPYLGIGPSAHSFNGTSRQWNMRNNKAYIDCIKNGQQWFEEEVLSPHDVFNELILTGLRTSEGVELSALERIAPISDAFRKTVSDAIEQGWMQKSQTHLILTRDGRLQADRIASDLFQINP